MWFVFTAQKWIQRDRNRMAHWTAEQRSAMVQTWRTWRDLNGLSFRWGDHQDSSGWGELRQFVAAIVRDEVAVLSARLTVASITKEHLNQLRYSGGQDLVDAEGWAERCARQAAGAAINLAQA